MSSRARRRTSTARATDPEMPSETRGCSKSSKRAGRGAASWIFSNTGAVTAVKKDVQVWTRRSTLPRFALELTVVGVLIRLSTAFGSSARWDAAGWEWSTRPRKNG